MADYHLACWLIGIMCLSLGTCLGFLILAILKAGSDNHWDDQDDDPYRHVGGHNPQQDREHDQ